MQNCGIKVEDKGIIKQIKEELKPTSYVECGYCGAIKVDAKELARAISQLESDEEINDNMNEILRSIIEIDPESELIFAETDEWDKWESENAHSQSGDTILI